MECIPGTTMSNICRKILMLRKEDYVIVKLTLHFAVRRMTKFNTDTTDNRQQRQKTGRTLDRECSIS